MSTQTFTAVGYIRNKAVYSTEHSTREAAIAELFGAYPRLKACSSGYGYHGSFAIVSHKREG